MSSSFLENLEIAEGESKFVIAINLDIRGFSDWCHDPAQSALYLKKLYTRLYADYFSDASMVKPTGDGLMIVLVTSEEDLVDVAVKTTEDAMEIVENFGVMTKDAKMINFDVPDQVGIGISRGSAVRLVADGATLDYSGRVLNVASRLMDLARPSGLILGQGFGDDLFSDELKSQFLMQNVFLKGVSPHEPTSISYWPNTVEIPHVNLKPLDEPSWEHAVHNCTFEVLKKLPDLTLPLSSPPIKPEVIDARVRYKKVLGDGEEEEYYCFHPVKTTLVELEGKPFASFDLKRLVQELEEEELVETSSLQVKVSYVAI